MIDKLRISKQSGTVLVALLESGGPVCGTDLRASTGVLPGTIYPMLIRLRGCGYLTSILEDGTPKELGRPQRCFYDLTEEGRAEAERIRSTRLENAAGAEREAA